VSVSAVAYRTPLATLVDAAAEIRRIVAQPNGGWEKSA
jgi:hypothetical protein